MARKYVCIYIYKSTHAIHLYISENLFCQLTCFITTQDIDPSRRPGAGPDGYVSLKNHPFFSGVDWDNLRLQTPPRIAAEPKVRQFLLFLYLKPYLNSFKELNIHRGITRYLESSGALYS